MIYHTFKPLLATLFIVVGVPNAIAQVQPTDSARWGLMVGAVSAQKPYRGYDRDNTLFPMVSYESANLSVTFPQVDYKFASNGPVSFRLRARYGLEDGYDTDDSAAFTGMDERKASLWLGGVATYDNEFAKLSAELLGATDHSKGTKLTVGMSRTFVTGSFGLTPRVTAIMADKKYVDYYYGVTAAEATVGRPAYQGKSNASLEFGLRVGYSLAPRQHVFLDVSNTRLGSAIQDSPLVDRNSVSSAMVGYLYSF